MRWIGWLLLTLVALGWMAAELPLAKTPAATGITTDWRRTRDGWQRASRVLVAAQVRRPGLHPGVVGMFEVLVSVTALVAFPASGARLGQQTSPKRNHCGRNRLRRTGTPLRSRNR